MRFIGNEPLDKLPPGRVLHCPHIPWLRSYYCLQNGVESLWREKTSVELLVLSFIFWVITFGANGAPKLFSAEKYVSPNFSNANSLRSVWRVEVNLKGTVFPPKLSHYFPPVPGYCEKIIACLCPSLWKSPLKIFSKTKITSQDKIHLSRYALPGVCLSSLSLKAEISLEATKTFLLSCRWKTIRQNAHQP